MNKPLTKFDSRNIRQFSFNCTFYKMDSITLRATENKALFLLLLKTCITPYSSKYTTKTTILEEF